MQTKSKINDALEILFSKDSRLRKLPKEESLKQKLDTEASKNEDTAELKKNEIKVGEIKLRGKV